MSKFVQDPISRLAARLRLWSILTDADEAALQALPYSIRTIEPNQIMIWEGEKPAHTCLLLAGYTFRQKTAGNGGRQILSIHLPGDIVDLHNSLLGEADHNVQALTRVEAAYFRVEAIRALVLAHPQIAMAMWCETLVDGSIFREWTLNVGRRDARTRIAHLLCEFAVRLEGLEEVGMRGHLRYELPMTQDQIADATGLTAVHVNRTLKSLERDGLITRTKRAVTIGDWQKLVAAGDFDPRYLHLTRGISGIATAA
jgi:CRP-like cAMP-binding protein